MSNTSRPSGRDVVIVDALRSPIGRRNGGLAGVHPARLLGSIQSALVERSGIDPNEIEQVVGGCVSQVGEQSFNVTRTAWLAAGLPISTAATTVDTQCGSSQQATNLATSLIAGGTVDVAMACGVEVMSRIPIGINSSKKLGLGVPIPKEYFARLEMTSQFEGAERIAEQWGITRADTDAFGLESQRRAAQAWNEDRFAGQWIPIEAPVLDAEGSPTDEFQTVSRDEGIRDTSLEKLSQLKPVARENGVHTAGNSSQISDGASAVLMMTAERAEELGLTPREGSSTRALSGLIRFSCSPDQWTQQSASFLAADSTSMTLTRSRSMKPSHRLSWLGPRRSVPISPRPIPTVEQLRSATHLVPPGRSS